MVGDPLTYAPDHRRRRIVVTIIGPARFEDLKAMVERQLEDGLWAYAVLYDERAVTAPLSVGETRSLVEVVADLMRVHGGRGPIAIVCRTAEQFGMARMYSLLAENAELESNVFHDLAAAEQWLDERAAERDGSRS